MTDREYPRQRVTRGEHDWVMAWTSERTFHIACGPGNLTEALSMFRTWAFEDVARTSNRHDHQPGEPTRSQHWPADGDGVPSGPVKTLTVTATLGTPSRTSASC
ncbi:Imm53 family immunity protein [Streptomyces sp. NPDC001663]|uniref:Imm53 family immunity protein n=1 Tax=Streptomyces sp. NPDC001663 TaxID=3364597 RepID=UPI00367D18E4